ncbi:unnamed protein product, partial [Ectocarpus sp. 12 AP-2014]
GSAVCQRCLDAPLHDARPLPPPSPSCGLRGSFLSEEGGDGDEEGAVGMMLPEEAWRVEKEEGEAVAASKIE